MGSGSSTPSAGGRVRRRRRHRRSWRVLVISAIICVPVLLAIPVLRYLGWMRPPVEVVHDAPAKSFDVVLAEAKLEGESPQRFITGMLRNTSSRRYEDVEVSFTVRDARGTVITTLSARVPSIGPNATVRFQSLPVPEGAVRISMREITGTAR